MTERAMPRHVAIIMDGNGRWAKQHGLDRSEGHSEGVVSVRKVVEAAVAVGDVKYLTVYTFSSENWKRPDGEIDALMSLMSLAVARETPDLIKNNVRLNVIGDLPLLPHDVRDALQESIDRTRDCTGLTLTLALSYSGRWDIAQAAQRIAEDAHGGNLYPHEVNEERFATYLSTRNLPDPDLLIRTGGEQRISNFLLWELSYTELYFTDTFWPDFREDEFNKALEEYARRERRFGKTSEQITKS